VLDHFVHEAGHVVLEGGGNLFDDIGSFLLFLLEFLLQYSEFLFHDLNQLVLLFLALHDFPFDFGSEKLRKLFEFLELGLGLLLVNGVVLS
jgi:hypothetical protein